MTVRHFIILILLSIISLHSCRNVAKEEVRHYDDETLVKVLVDLYAAQAALKDLNEDKLDSLREKYSEQIAAIHNVDMDVINKDIELLQANVSVYNDIHKIVQDSIISIERKLSYTNKYSDKSKKTEGKSN